MNMQIIASKGGKLTPKEEVIMKLVHEDVVKIMKRKKEVAILGILEFLKARITKS